MGDFKALHNVLLDQKESNALLVDSAGSRRIAPLRGAGKTKRGLVQDKQNRFGHQAASDRQHLLLAARQTAGTLRLALCRVEGKCRIRGRDSVAGDRVRAGNFRDRDCP